MANIENSEIIKTIVKGVLIVSGRRTLKGYAIKVVKTVLNILKRDYDFLKYVEIKDKKYADEEETVTVSSMIDAVDPTEISKSIDNFLCETYAELKDEGGLYFISELKEYLDDEFILVLEGLGLDLDKIQSEQHKLFNLQEREKNKKLRQTEPNEDKKKRKRELDYDWESVSTWEYNDNFVSLYDNQGKLLDKIELNVLIEDYVNTHTKFKDAKIADKMLNIGEKEMEFLQMLHSRDADIELAKVLLDISEEELDSIIQKLLEYEMLTHISLNEVKITEKGINFLLDKK